MLCLNGVKDETLPRVFREDGVYLSITGNKPCKLESNGRSGYTKPFSYNMFRVIDEDNVVMLGSIYRNFYIEGAIPPRIQIGYKDSDIWEYSQEHPDDLLPAPETMWPWTHEDKPPPYSVQVIPYYFQCNDYDQSYEIPLYEYLGITDPSNPLLTAQEVARLPKSKLTSLWYGCEAFSLWSLTQQINGPRYLTGVESIDEINKDYWSIISSESQEDGSGFTVVVEGKNSGCVGNISSIMVNNNYNLYTENSDNRLIYGIIPSEECPYIFVPDTGNKLDPDYQFAETYINDRWQRSYLQLLMKKLAWIMTY